MLLTPRQDNCGININNINMNLSPHLHRRHPNDNNTLNYHFNEQVLSGNPKCYSPRLRQRSKFPPHITICPPDQNNVIKSHYLKEEDLDNDVFQSTSSQTSFQTNLSTHSCSDDKQEVYSGRLYIIRQTGSTNSAPASPARSPSRSSFTSFPCRSSSPLCNQSSSPNSSPKVNRKTPVLVKVYRCNLDHFAVITRDVLYSNKPVYVNLRHSKTIPGEFLGRFIVTGSCDSGNVIEFEVPELCNLGQWLDAFQVYTPPASPNRIISGCTGGSGTPPIPRSPALPTLTETDEDD